jgi:hypothetical protein
MISCSLVMANSFSKSVLVVQFCPAYLVPTTLVAQCCPFSHVVATQRSHVLKRAVKLANVTMSMVGHVAQLFRNHFIICYN